MKFHKKNKFLLIILILVVFSHRSFAISLQSLVASKTFYDVGEDYALYNIELLQEDGLLNGYTDGSYRPNKKMNRAEFLKVIMEAANKNGNINAKIKGSYCFQDVKNQWFAPYVCAAKKVGIVSGYADGNFHPEEEVSILEASKIAVNAFKIELNQEDSSENWYKPYLVALATQNGIPDKVTGYDYTLTRSDMACMIGNILYPGYCENMTASQIEGVNSLEDPIRLAVGVRVVPNFYRLQNKIFIVDFDGSIHELIGANPSAFRHIAGDLYADKQNVFLIKSPKHIPIEVTYLEESPFDLKTLKVHGQPVYDYWTILSDKNNVYAGCNFSGPEDFQIIPNMNSGNIKLLYNSNESFYITDYQSTYLAIGSQSEATTEINCSLEKVANISPYSVLYEDIGDSSFLPTFYKE